MSWLTPAPGSRVRQTLPFGPFVVQRRAVLDCGGVFLTRHRTAHETVFVIVRYEERSEIGLPCHVVVVEDERDGELYIVDTGLMGPGLPVEAFELVLD